MGSMTVLVRRICEFPVIEEHGGPAEQIRMHGGSVPVIQSGVGNCHSDSGPVITQFLSEQLMSSAIPSHNFRSDFVKELHFRGGLDPQNRVGSGQEIQLGRINSSTKNRAAAQGRFLLNREERIADGCNFGGGGSWHEQDRDLSTLVAGQLEPGETLHCWMDLVLRAVLAHPLYGRQCPDLIQPGISKPGNKRIVRHVTKKVHARSSQFSS